MLALSWGKWGNGNYFFRVQGLGLDPRLRNPPPFKGLNIRIPATIPIKGRGFTNHGSGLIIPAPGIPTGASIISEQLLLSSKQAWRRTAFLSPTC